MSWRTSTYIYISPTPKCKEKHLVTFLKNVYILLPQKHNDEYQNLQQNFMHHLQYQGMQGMQGMQAT